MESFDDLLAENRIAVERFVRYRISVREDAEDVLQETYIAAYRRFDQLRDAEAFKPWLLSIARNKCNDYFREKARRLSIPVDALSEQVQCRGRSGIAEREQVGEALQALGDRDRQILYLSYWKELPQAEIARRLSIPVGTVKSRLYAAKQRFRAVYPWRYESGNGGRSMTKLPMQLPEYRIERLKETPFEVQWEELMGWMIVPKLGEKLSWGLYDFPSRRRTEYTDMEVVGRAEVHGIEGVEIVAVQHDAENYYRTGSINEIERRFVAQLTDTHNRYLAESHVENGVRKCYTFLDGESFMNNWGIGEDNCGNEIHLAPRGILMREGNDVVGRWKGETRDVVGRYAVEIAGKRYDTICVLDVECFNDAVLSEEFIDKRGRTVLWRRFNRDDWAFHRYQKRWSEMLPDNERMRVNGEIYVHWYDCISDYIL